MEAISSDIEWRIVNVLCVETSNRSVDLTQTQVGREKVKCTKAEDNISLNGWVLLCYVAAMQR